MGYTIKAPMLDQDTPPGQPGSEPPISDKGGADGCTAAICAQFAANVVAAGLGWGVVGDEGLARVPSPTNSGMKVHLIWSDRTEANRWASSLVTNPRLRKITLHEMTTELLPKLSVMGRSLGPDWSTEPGEPEILPGELDVLIRKASVARFCETATRTRAVWVVYDNGSKVVDKFPYNQRADADALLARKLEEKKGTFYINLVKEEIKD